MERLVIIGGGFAGLNLAKSIDKDKYEVVVIDRNNFHGFPPLFYQISASSLDQSNICFPFRREFRKLRNVAYHMGHVKNIDIDNKVVTTSYESIPYDKLVIAAGSTNNYFGMDSLAETTFGIKTVGEASHTRDEILDRLERGAICDDPVRRKELLSFMVVGGGPSGVEIAGAIGEMKRYILPREYPELDPSEVKVTLVEATDSILGAMGPQAGVKAKKYLNDLLVEVRTSTRLVDYTDKIVTFGDGKKEYWETLIWTAGVKGEPMPGLPEEMVDRGGRIIVDEYNRVVGHDDLFAIGDICAHYDDEYPLGLPQMAQPAIQQGHNLAKNLNAGELKTPFKYKDKGSMATVGKNKAVCVIGKTFISGFLAWVIWLVVHLMSLLGMKNKIQVMLNWIWNYFSYSSSLRLLLRPTKFPLRKHWSD